MTKPNNSAPSVHPLGKLFLITVVFTLAGTPMAVYTCQQAWLDWHAVAVEGVVTKAEYRHAPAGHRSKTWRVRWDVRADLGGVRQVSVEAPMGYRSEAEASEAVRLDHGRQVTIWYTPNDEESIRSEPPDWKHSLGGAVVSCLMAAVGWLGVAAFVQLAWRWLRRGKRLD